ncbi:MAG: iron ABC transporter permease [Planctomycetota bacterium]
MKTNRLLPATLWSILSLALLTSFFISLNLGSSDISFADICGALIGKVTGESTPATLTMIIWDLRIPRLIMAILAGAALSTAGAIMQTFFKNPLADPYILGAASGAGLGAVLATSFVSLSSLFGGGVLSLCAFAGALLTTMLVYFLARRDGGIPTTVLLLTGVAVGGLLQAFTAYFLLRQTHHQTREMMSWLMGSLSGASWAQVQIAFPVISIAVLVALHLRRELDLIAFGDEDAYHLGVPLKRAKCLALICASMLVAVSVAMCGVVAFVGLLVPHCARRIVGPKHSRLLPVSMVLGGILLIWADAVARLAIPTTEMPLGVVTSIAGCVFFLFALSTHANSHRESDSLYH